MGMETLLIAETSEAFAQALTAALSQHYRIHTCSDGKTALQLLETLRPHAVILNLALPWMDGLQVLRTASYKPPVVLALTTVVSNYILQSAKDAGAGYVIIVPCTVRCVVQNLQQMQRLAGRRDTKEEPQAVTQKHLNRLGLPAHRAGFTQLRVGIPVFAQDESQLLKKELYPAIATLCNNDNPAQVERSIREVIKEGWNKGDRVVWEAYFPGNQKPPTNKVFIATLAQRLGQEEK